MPRKRKFNPEITRVKLNPEQTVLTCGCFNTGQIGRGGPGGSTYCAAGTKGYKTSSSGNSAPQS